MIWEQMNEGLTYLLSQGGESLFRLFWFVIVFEIPRYLLGFLSVAALAFTMRRSKGGGIGDARLAAVIAGHNEEDSIARCVYSLREQSRPPDEIIVISDGSTDRMPAKLRTLQRRGLIEEAHCTQLRGGKSAAVNLALKRVKGNFVVNVDCDCTFDRNALKEVVRPFADPTIGAVAGNIVVRNPHASLIASFQAIEYLISISQGKQAANLTDQMTCVSGAFGAFRRSAIEHVGGTRCRRR